MLSSNVQNMIPKIQQYLLNQPIEKAWLFGSCSRGEEASGSDIDILVRYKKGVRISLFTISRIITSLSKILNIRVDVVEDECLQPFAKGSVDKDKILIYERTD